MITYFLGFISWQTWIIIIFIIIFILWVFHGGKEHRLIGLDPLDPRKNLKEVLGTEEYNRKKAELSPQRDQERNELKSDSLNGMSPDGISPDGPMVEVDKMVKKLREKASDDMDVSIDMTPEIPKEILDKKVKREERRERREKVERRVDAERKERKKRGRNGNSSKKEELCRQAIEEIYGKPFPTVRPEWLINPETGCALELDCYNEELKLAVEFNGKQHYCFPAFGMTKDQFIQQVRRDTYKINKCDEQGIYLITVPYTVPEYLIKDYITYYLPENTLKRQEDQRNLENVGDA